MLLNKKNSQKLLANNLFIYFHLLTSHIVNELTENKIIKSYDYTNYKAVFKGSSETSEGGFEEVQDQCRRIMEDSASQNQF
jgi:hypothetical protein